MSIPKTDQFPDDPEDLTPARRRRADRGLVPEDLVEIADDIENLAHKTIPSFDFFLFSLVGWRHNHCQYFGGFACLIDPGSSRCSCDGSIYRYFPGNRNRITKVFQPASGRVAGGQWICISGWRSGRICNFCPQDTQGAIFDLQCPGFLDSSGLADCRNCFVGDRPKKTRPDSSSSECSHCL